MYALSTSVNFLVNALVFWYGGQLIAYNGYGLTQFFTIFIAVVFGSMGAGITLHLIIFDPFKGRIFAYAPDMKKAKDSGESILNLLDRRSKNKNGSNTSKITDGKVEFKNVRFSYPLRPHVTVLDGLNLTVEAGQFAGT